MTLLIYFLNDALILEDYAGLEKKIDRRILHYLYYRKDYYLNLQNKTMEKAQSVAYDAYLKPIILNRELRIMIRLLRWL